MNREDYKIEFTRSAVRLAVLVFLTVTIARGDRTLWIWLAARAAVLIEYISFSLKDEPKDLVKNFLAHVLTEAVLAFGWYGAFVLFELSKKLPYGNEAVLHSTVPLCIKWGALLSVTGLVISGIMYFVRQKRSGF